MRSKKEFLQIQAYVIRNLGIILPSTIIEKRIIPHLNDLDLADPNFNVPGTVDVLFSAGVLAQILLDGLRKDSSKFFTAQNTKLGWIVMG